MIKVPVFQGGVSCFQDLFGCLVSQFIVDFMAIKDKRLLGSFTFISIESCLRIFAFLAIADAANASLFYRQLREDTALFDFVFHLICQITI